MVCRIALRLFWVMVMGRSSQGEIPVPTQDRILGLLETSTAIVVLTLLLSISSRVSSPFSLVVMMEPSSIHQETIGQNQVPSRSQRFESQQRRLKNPDSSRRTMETEGYPPSSIGD